jgi:hypothetical protein
MPGHGDAFAICSADGELRFREASTGEVLDTPEVSPLKIIGPRGGPVLIRDAARKWWIWTEAEGRRRLPRFLPSSSDVAPFLGPDGQAMIAYNGERAQDYNWEIMCSEVPTDVGSRSPGRRLHGGQGALKGIMTLPKPGGGALILLYHDKSITVLDSDCPEPAWSPAEAQKVIYFGAALLHLPGPVLAVCEPRRVLLWDLPSRTWVGTLRGDNDIISDMTEVHVGPACRRRVLLAVAHLDGALRLWDPLFLDEPLAALDLDMAAKALVSVGSKLCLVNEEGALCIDVGGVVGL